MRMLQQVAAGLQDNDKARSQRARQGKFMSTSGVFARVVAAIGAGAVAWRRMQGAQPAPAWGSAPRIPAAKSQGAIPTLKMPTARGWDKEQLPVAAPGLKVNAFATGLDHPRWINVLPNGDVLIAEATQIAGTPRSVFHYAMQATMRRAAALGVSAEPHHAAARPRRRRCRRKPRCLHGGIEPAVRHGADRRHLLCRQHRRRGGVSRTAGADRITARRTQARHLQARRALDAQPAAERRWQEALCRTSARSATSPRTAWRSRQGLAAIYELDLAAPAPAASSPAACATGRARLGADHNVLWTVVNERDGIGDETPPDYLTSVRDGGFYGWPYCYWGQTVDDRVPQDPAMVAKAIQPDYALGGHTASLGLCWMPQGTLPGFPDGMVIGQHGSWNRSTLSGYKVVFVPFENGRPLRSRARHPVGLPRARREGVLRPAGRRRDSAPTARC